jgi:hypothetical protein
VSATTVKAAGIALLIAALGAAGTPSPSQTPNRPYTEVAILAVSNIEAREPDCDPRPCSEYYHVEVWGSENATRIKGEEEDRLTCQKGWLFTSSNANKSLAYHPSAKLNREALKTIVSTNFWGATVGLKGVTEGCPTSYHLDQPTEYPQSYVRPLGAYGAVRFNIYRDGSLWFEDKYLVEVGKKIVVSYARQRSSEDATYYVKGGFEIVNMGPWPADLLTAQSSGTVSRGPG